jgi:hypothetical protein
MYPSTENIGVRGRLFGNSFGLLVFLRRVESMDDNETKVATLYGRIIVACLAILVALWQIDVDLPVI